MQIEIANLFRCQMSELMFFTFSVILKNTSGSCIFIVMHNNYGLLVFLTVAFCMRPRHSWSVKQNVCTQPVRLLSILICEQLYSWACVCTNRVHHFLHRALIILMFMRIMSRSQKSRAWHSFCWTSCSTWLCLNKKRKPDIIGYFCHLSCTPRVKPDHDDFVFEKWIN